MSEFLKLLTPEEARQRLFSNLPAPHPGAVTLKVTESLGRVAAEDVFAPTSSPEFNRSAMDGFAVRAADTFGASDSLPAYLRLVGEVPMGAAADLKLGPGACVLIHTGGMLPASADAVVMVEDTQTIQAGSSRAITEVEVRRAVAVGENIIGSGEDVAAGDCVLSRGKVIRPAEIGGLLALGVTELRVARMVRVGIISSGDEIIPPACETAPGQVRDINSYTLAALVERAGGEPELYGIVPDDPVKLRNVAARALADSDLLLITAGSSASVRDHTASVINELGEPGVLVHGINTRPGKPTILGVCEGKTVVGLPGNPVSALVNGYLLVAPIIEYLLGQSLTNHPMVQARLTVNIPSKAGREDWVPVRLSPSPEQGTGRAHQGGPGEWPETLQADPIFGKSNLIFTLAAADGLLYIPAEASGLEAGDVVRVILIR
ncbi:MAG: molybdopterin molybdenumtransferase MoeA [Anaerolineales bacterium]|nr:molybdopterin molybdenumtransferase MoeA [Anaerolineales bacterium]